MFAQSIQALRILLVLSVITGLLYPLIITVIAQVLMPHQANGSLIKNKDGTIVGSELLGQQFSDAKYLWGRTSATSPYPYNAGASSGSNLGPTNAKLVEAVKARVKQLKDADPNIAPIPPDLVTSSGSGLDPHISVESAKLQVNRIATARGIPPSQVTDAIDKYTQPRQLNLLGEPTVNVLKVNLALDGSI
jgi:K+-transporting ATPase, C subunit